MKHLIAFRKSHPSISRSQFWREDVRWFGQTGPIVDLSPAGQTLAWFLNGATEDDDDIYVMVNAAANDVWFRVQEGSVGEWLLIADTGLPSPRDISGPGDERMLESLDYRLTGRSVVLLCRPRREAV